MSVVDFIGQGSILIRSGTVGRVCKNRLTCTGRFRQANGVVNDRIEYQIAEELPHLKFDLLTEDFGLNKRQ